MTAPVDVLLRGAVAALSQNKTYPADVALAVARIEEARAAIADVSGGA